MKWKKAQVEDADAEIDMSPMIDMVFLLLIFFIVASAVVDPNKPKVVLPSASKAKAAEDTTHRIQVSVDRNEQIWIGSDPVTLEQFKSRIEQEVEKDPGIRVFLRTDQDVPYRLTKKVMRACSEVCAYNLIYATFEEN
jgi:biopolymer transport protein ExbD